MQTSRSLASTPRVAVLLLASALRATLSLAAGDAAGATSPVDPAATFAASTEVTATAVAEERRDVPATVRVVDGAEARARQAESVLQLLATVPGAQGFALGPPGQQASLFVRGADSNQTLVLWNGIPLNDPFLGAFNFAFLPTDGLQRLEVVPGPFSALYGSSAMGGVVQVLTARVPGVRADLEGGQRRHRRAVVAAGFARGPLFTSATGHWREGEGGLSNDAFDSRELSARLQWAGAGSEASLLARWNDSDTGIPRSGFTPTPRRHIDWQELEWGVPWSHVGEAWQLDGTLSQLRYDAGFRDPDDPFGFTAEDTDSRDDRARAVATRRLGSGSPGLTGWWAGGAEWERQTVSDRSVFGPSLDGSRQRTAAAFTQLHLEGGRWAADLGVRHDDNDVFGGATSPRAGVVVAAGPQLRLRASYGEAFRAPALGELFFPFFGNRDLRPERGRSAEVGAQWSAGPWSLDVAAFDNRQHDLIDFDFTTSRDVNVGRARSHGVDGELRFQQHAYELRLGGMRLHAEDRTNGRPLRNRPRDTAHLVAVARPGRATLALTGSWVGERVNAHPETFADTRNPGYFTLDVAGSWQLVRAVAPYARLLNALDRDHEPVLGFPAPGRTLIAGVRLEW